MSECTAEGNFLTIAPRDVPQSLINGNREDTENQIH